MPSSSTQSDLPDLAAQQDMAQYDLANYVHALRVQLELDHEERMADLEEHKEELHSHYESLRDEVAGLTDKLHEERTIAEDSLNGTQELYEGMESMYMEILNMCKEMRDIKADMEIHANVFVRATQLAHSAKMMFNDVKLTILKFVKRHARGYIEQRELK